MQALCARLRSVAQLARAPVSNRGLGLRVPQLLPINQRLSGPTDGIGSAGGNIGGNSKRPPMRLIAPRCLTAPRSGKHTGEAAARECGPVYARSSPALHSAPCRSMLATSTNIIHADDFVVLSGSLEAGSFHRIANGPSEGRWAWGAGLGAATAGLVAGGYVDSPDKCRTQIGRSFRSMLARADLRERPDAKPGPPRREPAEAAEPKG